MQNIFYFYGTIANFGELFNDAHVTIIAKRGKHGLPVVIDRSGADGDLLRSADTVVYHDY